MSQAQVQAFRVAVLWVLTIFRDRLRHQWLQLNNLYLYRQKARLSSRAFLLTWTTLLNLLMIDLLNLWHLR